VNLEIDNNLKIKMILKLQEIGLKFKDSKKKGLFNIQTFGDIILAWKCDASHDQAVKGNTVMHGTFDDEQGYGYYLKSNIIKRMKVKYENNIISNIKGCIARMIVDKKCVPTKLINKRAEKCIIFFTKRTSAQDGKMKAKATFHVSSNGTDDPNNVWFMRDGSVCDGSKSVASKSVLSECNAFFYMKKIKRLDEELASKTGVTIIHFYVLHLYDTYVC